MHAGEEKQEGQEYGSETIINSVQIQWEVVLFHIWVIGKIFAVSSLSMVFQDSITS